MNKSLLSLGIAMVVGTGAARAQVAVFDPANFQENLLTAARTLEQIHNQVRQLQNQAQLLANQERDLTGLDFSALPELRTALDDSRRLLVEAQGLSFHELDRASCREYVCLPGLFPLVPDTL